MMYTRLALNSGFDYLRPVARALGAVLREPIVNENPRKRSLRREQV